MSLGVFLCTLSLSLENFECKVLYTAKPAFLQKNVIFAQKEWLLHYHTLVIKLFAKKFAFSFKKRIDFRAVWHRKRLVLLGMLFLLCSGWRTKMENLIMKKHKTMLTGFVLGLMVLLVGIQGAMAQTNTCKGIVYFKAPEDWSAAYIGGHNVQIPQRMTKNDEGYYQFDVSRLGITDQNNSKICFGNQTGAGAMLVTQRGYNVTPKNGANDPSWSTNDASIPCPGEGNSIYVTEDPRRSGYTYTGTYAPDAKYFYMLVPDDPKWQSDDLMITYTMPNGTKKDTALVPNNELCGWVYLVFNNAPEDAVVYLKNSPDVQLGINGLWGEDSIAMPIDLNMVFTSYGVNKIYFIPNDADWPIGTDTKGWYTTDPGVTGTCAVKLAAVIYDTDMSLNTAFSDCCGSDKGNAPTGVEACVGVKHGLVKTDLGPDNKPVFSGSADAVSCFGGANVAEANFKALFNYVQGKNEVQCYDMPFRHYGTDTRWGFDSDSMVTNGLTGGFYPLEESGDDGVVELLINGTKVKAGPLFAARKKREAAGPVPNNAKEALGMELDYFCETPGWPSTRTNGVKNCQGLFADGDEFKNPDLWCWGDYCQPGFERWGLDGTIRTNEKRNQHFCFESHATFTYNESQEFTFRGDDDIWVFINRKIAVDNGGAHLAAPGHVVLKNLNTTYGADFLVPGNDYPIDIFFCDRRTTMSNVIIKTNMYIKQSTGIDFKPLDVGNGGLLMDICVEKTGASDCSAIAMGGGAGGQSSTTTECGDEISTNIAYSIKTRKKEIPPNCADCAALPQGGMVHGGIDLSNPKKPVVYSDKITGLPPGTYRLYFTVDDGSGSTSDTKREAYFTFKVKGNLGIVNRNVKFENVDGDTLVSYLDQTEWKFVDQSLAGIRIPIYISAPAEDGTVDLVSARGQTYQLLLSTNAGTGVNLYKNENDDTPLSIPYPGIVNARDGIDTFWVDVPLAGFPENGVVEVTATVGNTSAKLTFKAPQITFAKIQKDSLGNLITWEGTTGDPDKDVDGSEYFHWVNSDVDFYVVAWDPVANSICTKCNFRIDTRGNSDGLEIKVSDFVDGIALVRVRSSKEYSVDPASMYIGSLECSAIVAPYGNMHFYKPPAPMPLVVDVFDVKGAPLGEMNIPSQYYNSSADYLDGRADSLAIIYDRKIHTDSVPTFICLNFDERNLKKINPYKMKISNNERDSVMECSTQFDSAMVRKAYDKSPDGGRTLVFSVDSAFSLDVKTIVNSENKIASFTEYEWKRKPVRTFFEKGLTDRIAPVILSARVTSESGKDDYDQLRVIASEPVIFNDANNGTKAFTFYLNSAIDIQKELERLVHSTSQATPQRGKDTLTLRYYNADVHNPTPHVGDYIRFRGDAFSWTDAVTIDTVGDTLRPASDKSMHWNSPTDYLSTARLPSPWVQVVGDAKISVKTVSFAEADPSSVTDSTPVGKVYPVKTTESFEDVKQKYPGVLGHYVQSDMGSIIGSDDNFASIDKDDIYFFYEVDYFTNLGAFVARQSGKIKCTDPFFSPEPDNKLSKGDCVKNPRNFFIAWNKLSKRNRLVGTGAYITKYSSFVKVGNYGKKAKKELTEVWGVKRVKGHKAVKK